MKKIEHLGIAVKDIDQANLLYEKLLGTPPYKKELVEEQSVLTSFFKIGKSKIELLASTSDNGPIAKFLSKKGEGIHHIAFEVSDIYKEIERLRDEGFEIIGEHPVSKGADNKLVAFLHPKSTRGTLIELCQEIID